MDGLKNFFRRRAENSSQGDAPGANSDQTTEPPPKERPAYVPPTCVDRWPGFPPKKLAAYWKGTLESFSFDELKKTLNNSSSAPLLMYAIEDAEKISELGKNDEPAAGEKPASVLLVVCSATGKYLAGARNIIPLYAVPALMREGIDLKHERAKVFTAEKPYLPLFNPNYLGPDLVQKYTFAAAAADDSNDATSRFAARWCETGARPAWGEFWKHACSLFCDIVGEPDLLSAESTLRTLRKTADPEKDASLRILVCRHESSAATKSVRLAYEHILGYNGPSSALALFNLLGSVPKGTLFRASTAIRQGHLAHMDEMDATGQRELFPLDGTQRRAVSAALALGRGELLAVNGPPGSGKTAMLRSLIASAWVQAAHSQAECPIIVAVGATNQSVNNVIKAFTNAPHRDDRLIEAKRWIPDAISYGASMPSKSKLNDPEEIPGRENLILVSDQLTNGALHAYQRDKNPLDCQRLPELEREYLRNAKIAFKRTLHSVEEAVRLSWEQLERVVTLLHAEQASNAPIPLSQTLDLAKQRWGVWATSRTDTFQQHLSRLGCADTAEKLLEERESIIDLTWRAEALYWACHYWEGKFILSQREMLFSRHPNNVIEAFRRLCMLTPCVVSTVNSLPSRFEVDPGLISADDPRLFLCGVIDYLIIDEAGQAPADLGAAAFAYAQRAVVVGDVAQLKPIVKISPVADRLTARRFELTDYSALCRSERAVASASVLSLTRPHSRFHEEDTQGVRLLYHYRCVPTIIEYCNALSYDRLLKPMTKDHVDPQIPHMSWVEVRPTGDGGRTWRSPREAEEIVEWIQGEWHTWKAGHYKTKRLYEIVAILTGYRAQADMMQSLLCERFENLRKKEPEGYWPSEEDVKKVVVGTVHQLQGAECPIVCFSLVETAEHATGSFTDRDKALMNVAVSRAKTAFVIFADPGRLFGPAESTGPIHRLGAYMKSQRAPKRENESAASERSVQLHETVGRRLYPTTLVLIEAPGKLQTLQQILGKQYMIQATGGALTHIPVGGVFVEEGFVPTFEIRGPKAKTSLSHIAQEIKGGLQKVIFATDDDRMGEYIGWIVMQLLKEQELSFEVQRVRLGSLSKAAVLKAFDSPLTGFNDQAIAAEAARECLDALFTAKITDATRGPSQKNEDTTIGRVMAAVVRLVAQLQTERNRGRDVLVPVILDPPGSWPRGVLDLFGEPEQDVKYRVRDVESVRWEVSPPSATTLEIMMRASWKGHPPWNVASALQKLYDGSWSSSPTTATGVTPPVEPHPPEWGGHPPVHPLDRTRPPESLNLKHLQKEEGLYRIVYQIVWDLFTASETRAIARRVKLSCDVLGAASGQLLGRADFATASCDNAHNGILPDGIFEGSGADDLAHLAARGQFEGRIEQFDTCEDVPPWLVLSEMGKLKIGKASTYGGTLQKLVDAKYVLWTRDKVTLTQEGRNLAQRLATRAPTLSDPEFSSRLGERLDRVEKHGDVASLLVAYAEELGWTADPTVLRAKTWNTPSQLADKVLTHVPVEDPALIGTSSR